MSKHDVNKEIENEVYCGTLPVLPKERKYGFIDALLVLSGYCIDYMVVFESLLHDADERVRMEAPEIFRVLGKRRPEFVRPYEQLLKKISETDENRVVRIHCLGALKTISQT